jgi:hypothetical protein
MAPRKTAAATPATPTPAEVDRDRKMRAAYQSAERALKEAHPEEWNGLLDAAYAEQGVEVRRRLTDEERAEREAAKIEAKRQKLLAQLAELNGQEPFAFEAAGDPFAA